MQFSLDQLIYGSKGKVVRDIYLNGMVDMDNAVYICNHINAINEYDEEFEEQQESINRNIKGVNVEKAEREPIRIHICSYGGSVIAGTQIMNAIMTSKTEVHAYVTTAISMAFCIAVICDRRIGYDLSMGLHHDTSTRTGGNLQHIEESIASSKIGREQLDKLIMERTEMPKELMDDIILRKLDYEMYIDELLERKIIDYKIEYNVPAHQSSKQNEIEIQTTCGESIIIEYPEGFENMTDEQLQDYILTSITEKTGKAIDEEGYLVPLAEDDERKVVEEVEEDEEVTVRRTMLEDATEEELLDLLMIIGEDEPELIELSMAVEPTKDNLIELIMLADF